MDLNTLVYTACKNATEGGSEDHIRREDIRDVAISIMTYDSDVEDFITKHLLAYDLEEQIQLVAVSVFSFRWDTWKEVTPVEQLLPNVR